VARYRKKRMSGIKAASVFARNELSHRGLIIRDMAPGLLNELNAVAARVEFARVGFIALMNCCSFAFRMCQLDLLPQLSRIFQTSRTTTLSRKSQETGKVWGRFKYLEVRRRPLQVSSKDRERETSTVDVEQGIKITI
jgi:hypothetical protein